MTATETSPVAIGKRAGSVCAARERQMLALSESGMTLAAIGEQFGLTRERIRQIIGGSKRKLATKPRKWKTRYWHKTMRAWLVAEGYDYCYGCKLWQPNTKRHICRECNRKKANNYYHSGDGSAKDRQLAANKLYRKTPHGRAKARASSYRKYQKLKATPEGKEKLREQWRRADSRRRNVSVSVPGGRGKGGG